MKTSTIIGIVAIAVVLVVLYLAFRNFDFKGLSSNLGGFGTSLSDRINGFFESFENTESDNEPAPIDSDPTKQTPEEQEEIFGRTLTDDEENTINDIEEALDNGDSEAVRNIITQFDGADTPLNQFNPEGIFGYGILGKDKRGIPVSIANELGIYDYTTSQLTPEILDSIAARLADDNADSTNRINSESQTLDNDDYTGTERDTRKTEYANERPEQVTPPNPGTIDQKDFQFYNADGGQQTGVVRETPTNLREGETASQRANRIFETTGDFIENARSQANPVTSYDGNFDFGSNTGSGRTTPTQNQGGETIDSPGVTKRGERRNEQALLLEEERARLSFNSGDINNF